MLRWRGTPPPTSGTDQRDSGRKRAVAAFVLSSGHGLSISVQHPLWINTASELEHIRSQLEQAESKKRRYLDAFEQNKLDKSTVAERMQEIKTELNKLQTEKSRLELELTEGNTSPVSFEQVRELIHGFHQVLTAAPFEEARYPMLFISLTEQFFAVTYDTAHPE